jgi:hypothetical protein
MMTDFHFFLTSAFEWIVETDLKAGMRFMDKQGYEYFIWYVPGPSDSEYDIERKTPQVEGAVYLGKFQPK